jgi:hypothetical protein
VTFVRERRAGSCGAFIAIVVVGLLSLMIFGAVLFFRSDTGRLRPAAEEVRRCHPELAATSFGSGWLNRCRSMRMR